MAALVVGLACIPADAVAQDKWGAHLDFEARVGSKRSLGEGDLLVPLMQDSRTLLFGSLRTRFDDQNSREGNLGLGLRRMAGDWNFGGYGYLDRRKTGAGNYFNQASVGAEALGRDWDVRGNLYRPSGERVRSLGETSTASISGGSVVVTTVAREERALEGYDAEVGWRVPLFAADEPSQLRVYAGGYRFSDDAVTVSGPRLRAELTVAELAGLWRGAQLIAGAEVQDDDQRGEQRFLSVRLRVPLGGDAERSRLSLQERRMTTPVVRDVDIMAPQVARSLVETATVDGRPVTVVSSETTSGAALPAAVTAAGANSTVVLSGTFNTTAETPVQPGQTLMAGTLTARTLSGRTATLTTTATIAGNVLGDTVVMSANSTISGLTVRNANTTPGQNSAISSNGANGVRIINNTLTAAAESTFTVDISNGTNAEVRGNNISATGINSFGLVLAVATNATVSNNIFSSPTAGAIALAGSTNTTISGNKFGPLGNSVIIAGTGVGADTFNSAGSTGNSVSGAIGGPRCMELAAGASGIVSFTDGNHCSF
jgi:parallel beta-helix repeat protein